MTGYRESLSEFCESRGYEQYVAVMFGSEIFVQFGWICYDPVDQGNGLHQLKKVRKLIVRKQMFQKQIVRIACPGVSQEIGRPSIPRITTFLASLVRSFVKLVWPYI